MPRSLFATIAVLALALPAAAQDAQAKKEQDAEVGKEYEITIETEVNNPYTGPFGRTTIGSIVFAVPEAKVKERYKVKVTDIRENQYTGDKQASCDFEQIDGDRKGMCIPAP